ncbi:FliH/SctL family protein [Rhodanobacter ginsengisoli]|uniref:Flagellar assembly protein FliH n=1 Tax=Rhodanobacter ginsengisoli TaxID=418646 RepID=A0ABW0QJM0_9GAMM
MAVAFQDAVAEFRRWELPEVGTATSASETASPAQPTVRELEALEQQAREEGYAAGHAEGLAASRQQLDEQLARLAALYEAAARPLESLDAQTELELARLASLIASRVVGRELQLAPALIVQTVREAAAALPAATRELRVHLHPDDLNLLRELGAAEEHWQLLVDPALARGDCRMESERSRLDARVETRLAAVIDAVLGDDAVNAEAGE